MRAQGAPWRADRKAGGQTGSEDMSWQFEMHPYVDHFGMRGGLLLLVLYFAPSIIAVIRGHLSAAAIFVLNLVLGWTFIGWIVALIWSLTGNTARNRGARY